MAARATGLTLRVSYALFWSHNDPREEIKCNLQLVESLRNGLGDTKHGNRLGAESERDDLGHVEQRHGRKGARVKAHKDKDERHHRDTDALDTCTGVATRQASDEAEAAQHAGQGKQKQRATAKSLDHAGAEERACPVPDREAAVDAGRLGGFGNADSLSSALILGRETYL